MAMLIERKRAIAKADDFLENEDLFLQLDLKFHLAMARAELLRSQGLTPSSG